MTVEKDPDPVTGETPAEVAPDATAPDVNVDTPAEPAAAGIAPDYAPEPARMDRAPASVPPADVQPAGIQHAPPPRRGGFFAPFLGGVVAAALGFGLSHYNVFDLRADPDTDGMTADIARLAAQLKEQGQTAASASKGASDAAAAADAKARAVGDELAAIAGRIDGLDAQVRAQAEALPDGTIPPAAFAALKAEVDALKNAPAAAPGGQIDAGALRQQITAELDARAREVAAEAERAAEATRQTALRDAAWITLNEAVKNGQPYAEALTALGVSDVPEALAAHAAEGLPGEQQLVARFPDAAREALDAALRSDEAGGFGDRALSLLRVTTGQRSLTPREGTDPDAVLSRAEAAVVAGDLPAALNELEGLPPEGQAAMGAWVAQARTRIDAEAALAALKP